MDFAPKVNNPFSKSAGIRKGLMSRVAEVTNPDHATLTQGQLQAMDEETLKKKI
jgi:hypothetical protein